MSASRRAAGWRAGLAHAEAVTCLGESLAETALLMRAGISGVGLSDFVDAEGHRVVACACPALPPDLPSRERLLALAAHALAGVHRRRVASGPPPAARPPILLLGLPARFALEPGSYELNVGGRDFVQRLSAALPPDWAGADIEAFPFGRAAGAIAMARALQLAESRRDVIWGGVDTLLHWPALEALQQRDRLLTNENVDGVRPGEAAAFAMVTPTGREDGWVAGLGLGREPHPVGSEAPCRSDGFAQALASAVEPLRAAGRRCAVWTLDASHEKHATREVQNIIARFGDVLDPATDLRMPLKALGDVGAAALPLMAALVLQDWAHGVARDGLAVLAAGSDDGARGALLLAAREPDAAARAAHRHERKEPA
ncbi:MAG: hypothetical protein J7598_16955 [Mitsuaria chitosanitabida]|uniref:hypothetical protein n=1 Tax=Roseateles chitosanitabidus TaxID=65048 RepID=UPI001B026E59|nr:hypothetical protein [Roseateles chitosanitabidus]MBO9688294.1 hypothetical protein [Roseateles chitosanitabidus]